MFSRFAVLCATQYTQSVSSQARHDMAAPWTEKTSEGEHVEGRARPATLNSRYYQGA